MEQLFNMLVQTPWPWIILGLFLVFIFFRRSIERLIDRTQKAKAKATKGGAEIEFESFSKPDISDPAILEEGATKKPEPLDPGNRPGVEMKDVLLDNSSEIDEVVGNVKIDNLTLDRNSRIGKIKS